MEQLTDYFKGLADSNRIRILNLLLHGELCGCDIQHIMETLQPNVSRHLTYLKNCGLVKDRRVGYRVFYALAKDERDILKSLFKLLRNAFSDEEILRQDIRRLEEAMGPASHRWHSHSAPASLHRVSGVIKPAALP